MYLAMARVAHREGYPEIGIYWEKAAYEEAEHAADGLVALGVLLAGDGRAGCGGPGACGAALVLAAHRWASSFVSWESQISR